MTNNIIGNNFIPSMNQVAELRLAAGEEASPVLDSKKIGPLTAEESHLVDVKNRLDGMLKNSIAQSGGISLLDKALIPLPDKIASRNPKINALYSSLLKQDEQIKAYLDALNQIPMQRFKDDTGLDEALHGLIDKAVNAYQEMEELGQKLYSAYVEAGKNPPAFCDELEYACPARISELYTATSALRMLGAAERGDIKPDEVDVFENFQRFETAGKNFSDIMRGLATNMHGMSEAMSSLTGQAETLFGTIDKLEGSYQALDPTQLGDAIASARKELEQLIAQIGKDKTGSTEMSALRQGVHAAEQRLNLLLAPDCKQAIIKKINTVLGEKPTEPFKVASNVFIDKPIQSAVEALDAIKVELLNHAKNGTLTADVFAQAEKNIRRQYTNAAKHFYPTAEKELGKLFGNHFLGLANNVRTGALEELKSVCQSAADKRVWSPHEVALAVTSANAEAELGVLLEVGLRGGAMRNYVDLEANDKYLVTEKQLGAGAMNTVQLLTYKNSQGEEIKRVFKAEYPIQTLLKEKSRTPLLILSQHTRVAELNVASNLVAAKMGQPDIIARSKVGVHDSNYGIFMEFKPGIEGSKFRKQLARALESMTIDKGIQTLGNLHHSLCDLEWADALSGQTDRHYNNYLVDLDSNTGAVNITGIDNDMSFGRMMLGPGLMRYDKTVRTHLKQAEIKDPSVFVDNNSVHCVDITKLSEDSREKLQYYFAMNQMVKPQYIDRKTYDSLRSIDETAYQADLGKVFADTEQIEAAVIRLRAAKAHAEVLAKDNKVIDDWASRDLINQVVTDYSHMSESDTAQIVSTNFLARDFGKQVTKYAQNYLNKP